MELLSNKRIFIKIGGSFITDKSRTDSFKQERVRTIARAIRGLRSLAEPDIVLAHGAGAYGHIKAKFYNAQQGIHPEYGWRGFYEIRREMTQMNLEFVKICLEEGLNAVTVQPSAIITAAGGNVISVNAAVISRLLDLGQIPVLHGDIVVDDEQGFTIASTEDILTALVEKMHLSSVVMISDVPGVLDESGEVIPEINPENYETVMRHLGGAKAADVTGGMRDKVKQLYQLIRSGKIKSANIISSNDDPEFMIEVLTHRRLSGTVIR
ncbi:hypothetical protein GF337_09105 [candidate division KSB1 bacterium]|nr:hypothetical protein [candidate division KSB1 bacterium]